MDRSDDERFRARYEVSSAAVLLELEREVLGSDYQANGYTTLDQADELGRCLGLRPGHVLADIGAGCGWPGLYLAQQHGCTLVTADPVEVGVGTAHKRAVADGLTSRVWPIRAEAESIPLRSSSIDALVHTDVLC